MDKVINALFLNKRVISKFSFSLKRSIANSSKILFLSFWSIFFDFTLNVPKRFTKLKCVYCFAVLQEQKTKIRALPVADCEPDADGLHQCVIGISRDIKKVPPIKGSRCIIEIQAVSDIPGETNIFLKLFKLS